MAKKAASGKKKRSREVYNETDEQLGGTNGGMDEEVYEEFPLDTFAHHMMMAQLLSGGIGQAGGQEGGAHGGASAAPQHASSSSSSEEVKVEEEEVVPSQTEGFLVAYLAHYGFHKNEVMSGIRRTKLDCSGLKPDDPRQMMEAVNRLAQMLNVQRTQEEDSRQMDEARLQSESEKERNKQLHEEQTNMLAVWGNIMNNADFAHSTLFHAHRGCKVFKRLVEYISSDDVYTPTALMGSFREIAVKLLVLEQRCLKWYPQLTDCVESYFADMAAQMSACVSNGGAAGAAVADLTLTNGGMGGGYAAAGIGGNGGNDVHKFTSYQAYVNQQHSTHRSNNSGDSNNGSRTHHGSSSSNCGSSSSSSSSSMDCLPGPQKLEELNALLVEEHAKLEKILFLSTNGDFPSEFLKYRKANSLEDDGFELDDGTGTRQRALAGARSSSGGGGAAYGASSNGSRVQDMGLGRGPGLGLGASSSSREVIVID